MEMRSRYIFGAALAGLALGGVPGIVNRAHGATITQAHFSFETSGLAFSSSATQGTAPFGPLIAESGTGSAYGSHAATNAVFSSPAGNGSAHSFSSNVWAPQDYYQFNVPTTGIQDIVVSYDQIGSSTGPQAFTFVASEDGIRSDGTTVGSYSIGLTQNYTDTNNATGTESTWSPTKSAVGYNESFNLSSLSSLDGDASAAFFIVDSDTAHTATAGTSRLDNVIVSGTAAVPEPAAMTLLTVASAGLMLRRKSKSLT
jgi:hypothetical protein